MKHMKEQRGFSLIELVITITVLTILTMGVLPLVKISVKRQKEQQLRETLRQIRIAIDEFHRDTIGMVCTGAALTPQQQAQQPQQSRDQRLHDLRSRQSGSLPTRSGNAGQRRQRVAERFDGWSRAAGRERNRRW